MVAEGGCGRTTHEAILSQVIDSPGVSHLLHVALLILLVSRQRLAHVQVNFGRLQKGGCGPPAQGTAISMSSWTLDTIGASSFFRFTVERKSPSPSDVTVLL